MMKRVGILGICILPAMVGLAACSMTVNGPIDVGDGETRDGNLTTVNGTITIGDNCTIRGTSRTVNGRIDVGHESEVAELQAVNGSIQVGHDSVVDGDVDSVNGSVKVGAATRVLGDLNTVNGRIETHHATLERGITTVNGDIRLADGSVVKGDILIDDKPGNSNRRRPLEIELSGGSTVEGNIIVEDPDNPVKVLLLDGSKVLGRVEGAEVVEG